MIELDKRDIEYIGYQRYSRAHYKKFVIMVIAWLVTMLAVMAALRNVGLPAQIEVVAIISAGWFYWFYRYLKAQDKEVKEFLSQCEADPELIYKEAADKKDATDWL